MENVAQRLTPLMLGFCSGLGATIEFNQAIVLGLTMGLMTWLAATFNPSLNRTRAGPPAAITHSDCLAPVSSQLEGFFCSSRSRICISRPSPRWWNTLSISVANTPITLERYLKTYFPQELAFLLHAAVFSGSSISF